MPLNPKGRKIMRRMRKTYGARAEQVFYASKNKGTISGVDKPKHGSTMRSYAYGRRHKR